MLGDTGVAVHPDDERYAGLVGKDVILPIVNRRVPIIADDYADPEKGSGAVKITPAHDFNDYEVGKRAGHELISILDERGHILPLDIIPEEFHGLFTVKARKLVVAKFDEAGLLAETEKLKIEQPFGDRSGVVIEPMLTDQWFVDAEKLAGDASAKVEDGSTKFVPENWKKTYDHWMGNIQPWCISRQLWWGHQIPVWYGPQLFQDDPDLWSWEKTETPVIFCGSTLEEAKSNAEEFYSNHMKKNGVYDERHKVVSEFYKKPTSPIRVGLANDRSDAQEPRAGGDGVADIRLYQDPDVLDTWFSSGLWPFSTLGWPDKTPELQRFYPTSTLVTACLLYTSPSPRDLSTSRMPSSA